jgi:hypothetical protein
MRSLSLCKKNDEQTGGIMGRASIEYINKTLPRTGSENLNNTFPDMFMFLRGRCGYFGSAGYRLKAEGEFQTGSKKVSVL